MRVALDDHISCFVLAYALDRVSCSCKQISASFSWSTM